MDRKVRVAETKRFLLPSQEERGPVEPEDLGKLLAVYESVQRYGIQEPLVAEPAEGTNRLRVVDGDKRLRVALRLRIDSLPYVLAV